MPLPIYRRVRGGETGVRVSERVALPINVPFVRENAVHGDGPHRQTVGVACADGVVGVVRDGCAADGERPPGHVDPVAGVARDS